MFHTAANTQEQLEIRSFSQGNARAAINCVVLCVRRYSLAIGCWMGVLGWVPQEESIALPWVCAFRFIFLEPSNSGFRFTISRFWIPAFICGGCCHTVQPLCQASFEMGTAGVLRGWCGFAQGRCSVGRNLDPGLVISVCIQHVQTNGYTPHICHRTCLLIG